MLLFFCFIKFYITYIIIAVILQTYIFTLLIHKLKHTHGNIKNLACNSEYKVINCKFGNSQLQGLVKYNIFLKTFLQKQS